MESEVSWERRGKAAEHKVDVKEAWKSRPFCLLCFPLFLFLMIPLNAKKAESPRGGKEVGGGGVR